ncbi:50S ribosomal protein L13 [Nanoarchaeota archaeon]
MIIDATDLILGRMAAFVAKKALLGEKIDIVNCEKAVISGSKRDVLAKYKQRRERRTINGPFFPKTSDRLVRRTVRGMLPYKQKKGGDAFKRVMCYIGIPASLSKEKIETIKTANSSKLPVLKYISIGEISKQIGAKR